MKQILAGCIVMILTINSINGQQKSGFHVITSFPIASSGGWDYLEVSPAHDWIYVSHGSQVNIINKLTGDSVGVIENTTGVHGIAFDVVDKKGYTSNGRINTVTVFDINTNKVLGQIPAGQNPDAIMYEPFSKKIITCNGRSKNLSIIDPVTDKLVDSVDLGGKPETAVSDNAGKLFVNVEDKNEIAVVDTKTFKVIHRWSLAPGDGPTGLVIDRETKRLFATCDKLLVILDATNGNIVDKIEIGDGTDGAAFDSELKNVYTSNGADGTMSVIHEESASKFVLVETVQTQKFARTIAIDPITHHLFLPTAEPEPGPNQKGRPKMMAGSFKILVVGK